MRSKNKEILEFLEIWKKSHNPDFNVTEFCNIKNEPCHKLRSVKKLRNSFFRIYCNKR